MEIFIKEGDEEFGPFTRAEAFSLLQSGQVQSTTLACVREEDAEVEWIPVSEVLKKSAASTLFSLEQIEVKGLDIEPPKVFIEPYLLRKEPTLEERPSGLGAGKALSLAVGAMVLAFGIAFLCFRRSHDEESARALAATNSAPTPTMAAPTRSPATPPPLLQATPMAATPSQAVAVVDQKPKVLEAPAAPKPIMNAQPVSRSVALEDTRPTIHQVDLFKSSKIGTQELVDILTERFSSPPVQILDSHDERVDKTLKTYEGSFLLETPLKWNPQVEVIYKIPLRRDKLPGPHASNIVMLGFYPGAVQPPGIKLDKAGKPVMENGKPVMEESRIKGPLSYYADKLGYTAFSMQIVTKKGEWNDPKESYINGGPEWVDIVFRAKAEIEKRYRLKQKKLLLCGMSLGGTFVERIAAARPDEVAAVAMHSAPDITLPKAETDTAWFLGISRGDAMYGSYNHLFNALADLKDNTTFSIFPPNYNQRGLGGNFYHSESAVASTAARSFLKGVVDASPEGKIDITKWPFVRDRMKPLRIYRTGATVAAQIPSENREYLPSKAFVQCLESIPAPMQTVSLGKLNGRELKCLVGLPPLGKPKGAIIYSEKLIYSNIATMVDNIYYLANQGYLVFAPNLANLDAAAIKTTVGFIKKTPLLSQLPLVYVGSGEKGNCMWDFVAKDPEATPKAVAMISFEPGDALDESKWPVGLGIKCPILFVYDEKPLMNVATAEQAHESLAKVHAVAEFVKRCKERHQPARVIYIPKDSGSEIRVTQKAMESVDGIVSKLLEGRLSIMEEQ